MAERSASRNTDGVGRDDDRHRTERVAALQPGDLGCRCPVGIGAVRRGVDLDHRALIVGRGLTDAGVATAVGKVVLRDHHRIVVVEQTEGGRFVDNPVGAGRCRARRCGHRRVRDGSGRRPPESSDDIWMLAADVGGFTDVVDEVVELGDVFALPAVSAKEPKLVAVVANRVERCAVEIGERLVRRCRTVDHDVGDVMAVDDDAVEAPGAGPPASVGRSIAVVSSSCATPAGTTPGQRMMAGTACRLPWCAPWCRGAGRCCPRPDGRAPRCRW